MTIEERVEQLEAQVAQLTGEGDYTLLKSGETIDAILDGIETGAIYHGTQTVEVKEATVMVFGDMTLGFTPTAKTAVVASLRRATGPGPVGYQLNLLYTAGRLYYTIVWGGNTGVEMQSVPSGTYYIDWICIDKGVS